MDYQLLKTRFISFGYQLATLLGAVIAGALLNFFGGPDFEMLVNSTFGNTFVGTMILLVVTQVVAHFRNKAVLGKRRRIGAEEGEEVTII